MREKKILKTLEFVGFEKTFFFSLFTFTISKMSLCFLLVSYFQNIVQEMVKTENVFVKQNTPFSSHFQHSFWYLL